MLPHSVRKLVQCRFGTSLSKSRKFSSSITSTDLERDPAPFFFKEEVQKLLRNVTRVDLVKVTRRRKDGTPVGASEYRFMTDKSLQNALENSKIFIEKRLQMPPVVKARKEINEILNKDPEMQGYEASRFVFTDITYNVSNKQRIIVVREPNGTLRQAKWDERSRMNQIYFPTKGKEYISPKMFDGEYLMNLLKRREYEFLMDRACMQFDPDDPDYQRVAKSLYDHINAYKHYNDLRSTRHFGPFVFYLIWNKDLDNLLLDTLEHCKIEETTDLVKLFYLIHPNDRPESTIDQSDQFVLLNYYIETQATLKMKLRRALEAYHELKKEKENVNKGIMKQHFIEPPKSEM
ncbi:small ribosomal subunit protein mS22 [Prorops nasuta]|uniref:small ribosomal subunit protein mS22 n=1 Tax=Prorops nasuta TaxID=863751 RepID=UPI0034CF3075